VLCHDASIYTADIDIDGAVLSPCLLSRSAPAVGWECMKVRDVIKLIELDGWRLDRQRGSHRIYRHRTKPGTVTVAGHLRSDMPIGTLKNVLRQASMKRSKS
jgi:predicted RNA binding protein YcfA (HicA-like mRNA interferase family)